MYLLTGSSDYYKNVKITELLAGRMQHYQLYNLSIAQMNNYKENIIDLLFNDDISLFLKFSKSLKEKSLKHIFLYQR